MVKFIAITAALLALTASVSALPTKESSKDSIEYKEDFYYIYINEVDNELNKRGEKEGKYLRSVLSKINSLISGNIDTYKSEKTLLDLSSKISQSKLAKRDDAEDNAFTAPVYNYLGDSVYYSYLSPEVAELVDSLPNITVEQRIKLEFTGKHYYNENQILHETKWDKLSVQEDAPFYLSLISQGPVNEKFIEYDTNFYYQGSAGKDVDMYFFEQSFDFTHPEFSNNRNLTIIDASAIDSINYTDKLTLRTGDHGYHGEQVSDVAAGLKNGVAKNANLYGIVFEDYDLQLFNSVLAYIIENNLVKPNKTVFNLSFTVFTENIIPSYKMNSSNAKLHSQSLINQITEMGGIFVASAGNAGYPAKYIFRNYAYIPCALDNVICVGGVDTNSKETLIENENDVIHYRRHKYSNYGESVDIYAPFSVITDFYDINEEEVNGYDNEGTSFSAPIVSGVIASIVSDHPEKTFNHDSMLKYIRSIGHKGVITNILEDEGNTGYDEKTSENSENVFISNGKHLVYSMNGKYTSEDGSIEGCGVSAGGRQCSGRKCCSKNSICTFNDFKCKVDFGCQEDFGTCY